MVKPEDVITNIRQKLNQSAIHIYSSYFKYFSDKDDVLNSIFVDQKIRFTQPRAFNDPLEFSPTLRFHDDKGNYQFFDLNGLLLPSIAQFYRVQIIESQINAYGILSLTKIPDSFDMLSQYANGHKGFVIEFKQDFNQFAIMKSKSGELYPIHKVNYVEDYIINLDDIVDDNGIISMEIIRNELLLKKTSRWKNEQEYRIIRPLTDHPNYRTPKENRPYTDSEKYTFPFSWECVSSIIVGASMTQSKKKQVLQICRENNISVSQAIILRDQIDRFGKPSSILIEEINKDNDDKTLKVQPQIYCTDIISFTLQQDPEKISKISDLPYYKGHEKVVEEMYHNKLNVKKKSI
jgi:hypothetical protein